MSRTAAEQLLHHNSGLAPGVLGVLFSSKAKPNPPLHKILIIVMMLMMKVSVSLAIAAAAFLL